MSTPLKNAEKGFMKKLKLLIVDDEELIRDLFEMIIESEFPCEITKASNGQEGIQALKEDTGFDLIISDYTMPLSNGGEVYLFNKEHRNIPFFLFSGGDLCDYKEFNDFYRTNAQNKFFNKPFNDQLFVAAVAKIGAAAETPKEKYTKVKLSYFARHSENAAKVYIKLNDNKFTKIIDDNEMNMPDTELLNHYLRKGIEYIYLEKDFFNLFSRDIFNKFHEKLVGEKKAMAVFEMSGLNFHVSCQGLNEVGISNHLIEKVNEIIEETVDTLLNNASFKDQFTKMCESEKFIFGNSMLIMYMAGRIAKEANLNFPATMKKICAAAFYHDLSLFEVDVQHEGMKLSEITNTRLQKKIQDHPVASAEFLPEINDLVEETRKIIMEHHELPDGDGYPKGLSATQISSLGTLFILSEQISLCLIRNNFSKDRLKDFLTNSEKVFNKGNFSKFYNIARTIF